MAPPAIETHGLTRRFGAQLAVSDLSLIVPEARVYGYLGPNGAGKTTTIRMLLGLLRPDAGDVRLFGEFLEGNHRRLMASVGALVETPSLYPHLTGRENLEVTRRLLGADPARIDRALATVRLTADRHRRVREYSLGMRQRLGLALALLNEPRLLILDEPANGLDPEGIHEMRDLIRRLPAERGITVFLSSHLLGEVEQMADHIGIVHRGRLVFQGSLAELQTEQEEHLALGVREPDRAARCLVDAGWRVWTRGDGMLAVGATSYDAAARINRALVDRGLDVFHIARSRVSLEEIFLSLTRGDSASGEAA